MDKSAIQKNPDVRQTSMPDIGEGAASTGSQTVSTAQESLEKAQDQASGYYEDARTKVSEYAERGREYLARGQDQLFAMEEPLEQRIRQQPIPSVLIAAGVGFLIGMLWSR